jgi:hypothetical protein
MNFPGFEPARDLRLKVPKGQVANPMIRSAKFREIIDPGTYRQIRARPFRMHFQFLMANDYAGAYDIFALTLGPQCLRDRVLAENKTPLGADRDEAWRQRPVTPLDLHEDGSPLP